MEIPLEINAQEGASNIGKRSVHTNFLVQAMRQIPEGDTFTYAQAAEVTRMPKYKFMHYLYSAVNILLKEYGLNFQCDRSVGYTHVAAESVPALANRKQVKKIRNTTARYRDELEAVDPGAISQQSRIEHTLGLTNVAIMESVVNAKSQRELRKATKVQACDPLKGLDRKGLIEAALGLWK